MHEQAPLRKHFNDATFNVDLAAVGLAQDLEKTVRLISLGGPDPLKSNGIVGIRAFMLEARYLCPWFHTTCNFDNQLQITNIWKGIGSLACPSS